MTRRALSAFFLLTSLGVAYYLFSSVKEEVDARKEIEKTERAVIEQLREVRSLQKLYYAVYSEYANSWSLLSACYENDSIRIVERREEIIRLDYGAEQVKVHEEVIGVISVQDSLQSLHPRVTPAYMARALKKDVRKFSMWSGQIDRGGVRVDVVEVWDREPINPARREKSPIRSQKPLRFGSREAVTLSGNWE